MVPRLIKRACDQCRTRKVKCSGEEPCDTCTKSCLECSFLKPILPKGPIPRDITKQRHSDKHVPLRISRSSSPAKLARGVQPQAWSSDTWHDLNSSVLNTDIPNWNNDVWQPTDTSSTSAVLEGFWEEICARSCQTPLINNVNTTLQESPSESASTGTTILDGLPHTTEMEAMIGYNETSGEVSSTNDADLLSIFNQTVIPPLTYDAPQPLYNNFSILGSARPDVTSMPWSLPFCPPEDVSPVLTLTLETLVKPQLEIFFDRVYPMIPIFSRSFIFGRLSDVESHQNRTFVALILSMVSLSLIHPLKPEEVQHRPTRAKQSQTMMDEVIRLRSKWDWASQPSVEASTTSYMLFGTMFELGHTEGARLKLRESIGIGELLRLDDVRAYIGIEHDEARRRMRLFWVLGITERAYALQRVGSITFHGSLYTPAIKMLDPAQDLPSRTLLHLAKLFSFVDSNIVSCWNGKCDPSTCTTLTKQRVLSILRSLNGTPGQVFGSEIALTGLSEVQQADLLITWQWLRNRVWRLAAGHGLTEEGGEEELSVEYVVEVANTTVLICRRLSANALEAHGCGFVEKLYDIASIVTELIQTSTQLQNKLVEVAKTDQWTDLLQSLYDFVTSHRSGVSFVQPMSQALSVAQSARLLCVGSS
ncbi:uncharacterized protein L201_004563 [Kwoniella dendrophila CBS 6074]|uniref:Zn(2)-C6 fungal-type domain-containing protein n=1 Tax=Kwoniella dendrophila CBS 6074 TaxID=1295534 RepID=A0AAX4JYP2_9TREE